MSINRRTAVRTISVPYLSEAFSPGTRPGSYRPARQEIYEHLHPHDFADRLSTIRPVTMLWRLQLFCQLMLTVTSILNAKL